MIPRRIHEGMVVLDIPSAVKIETLEMEISILLNMDMKRIVLNLAKLQFTESTDLAALMVIYRLCLENGGDMVIFNLQPYAKRLMQLTKLDRVLKIYASESEALEYFRTFNDEPVSKGLRIVN